MSSEILRVAVVGAEDLQARSLCEALKEGGLRGNQVVPLGARLGHLELSLDVDATAEVFLPLEPEHVAGVQVIALFSKDPEARAAVAEWAREGGQLLLDMVPPAGAVAGWIDPLSGEDREEMARGLAFPDPAALYLSRALRFLNGHASGTVAAQVFSPVTRLGEAGALELFNQAFAILNFKPIPQDVLGRQVAFNFFPMPEDEEHAEFAAQVRSLSCENHLKVTCAVLQAPSFHGTALSVAVGVHDSDKALSVLDAAVSTDSCFALWEGSGWPSPIDVAGQERPLLMAKALDPETLWLWVVFDNAKAGKGALAARWLLAGR